MQAQEFHGLFQFQDFEEAIVKKEIPIDTDYVPIHASQGYFLPTNGLSEIVDDKEFTKITLFSINYYYLQKDYSKCLEMCTEWLEFNKKLQRPQKGGEIVDSAVRCLLKLNKPEKALEYSHLFHKDNQKEHGVMFVLGKTLLLNKLYWEAISIFIDYLHIRQSDYSAWAEIGNCFYRLLLTDWARVALDISLQLLTNSPRKETEFVTMHLENEIKKIQHVYQLTSSCTLLDSSVLMMDSSQIDKLIAKIKLEAPTIVILHYLK